MFLPFWALTSHLSTCPLESLTWSKGLINVDRNHYPPLPQTSCCPFDLNWNSIGALNGYICVTVYGHSWLAEMNTALTNWTNHIVYPRDLESAFKDWWDSYMCLGVLESHVLSYKQRRQSAWIHPPLVLPHDLIHEVHTFVLKTKRSLRKVRSQ